MKELEAVQVKLADCSREKKRFQRELEELEKEFSKQQKELDDKGEGEDVWALKTQLRDLKNETDDLLMRKDKIQLQIQRLQSGRVAVVHSEPASSSAHGFSTYSETSNERTSRVPPAKAYESPSTRSGARTSVLDKYSTTTTTSRQRSAEPTRAEQTKISDLKKMKREYETRSGSKVQEVEKIKKQISDATSQKEKTEQALKKLEEDQIQFQRLIKQEKELFQGEISSLNKRVEVWKKRNNQVVAVHLNKLNKVKKDRLFELSENQELLKQLTDQLQDKRSELRKLDTASKQKERNVQKGERELQNDQKQLSLLMDKIYDMENTQFSTLQLLEETEIEFEATREDLISEIHCLEREIYDQTENREYLIQVVGELAKEIDDLVWYFTDHKLKTPKDSRIYGTYEFDWIMHRRKHFDEELVSIDKQLASVSIQTEWKDQTLEDLTKKAQKAIKKMTEKEKKSFMKAESDLQEAERTGSGNLDRIKKRFDKAKADFDRKSEQVEDYIARTGDLINAMKRKGYGKLLIQQLTSLLAEHDVYAGVLNYLTLITNDQENLHVLNRPPMFITRAYQFWMSVSSKDPIEPKSFRRELKDQLVNLRVELQKRDPNFITNYHLRMLDGDPALSIDDIEKYIYWGAEYFVFFGSEGTREEIENEFPDIFSPEDFDEDGFFDEEGV
eukprot:TRINITY_DN6255_c0_g1_i10.p1 TRINITY_DN6255_c0_g1~~TRINITY_DN6255_c0_g1_i10.p1  ORF type:complete len:674 (-),score=184.84 TRINITY_DN6255_c0_g1_i10:51-2072(-)